MRVPPGARRVAAVLAASAALALVAGCGHSKARPPPLHPDHDHHGGAHHHYRSPHPGLPAHPYPGPGRQGPTADGVAVKVENLPQARPQYGLDQADIVFEEPVEGGITRFIVLYQCQEADRIEPVRSARFVDPDIVEPLGKILFAYSGAITPVVDEIDSLRLAAAGRGLQQGRQAPIRSTSPGWRRTTCRHRRRALYAAAKSLAMR